MTEGLLYYKDTFFFFPNFLGAGRNVFPYWGV